MVHERRETADASPTASHCLLLIPPGYDAPAELLGGLRRRGVTAREAANAPAAMVELTRRPYLSLIVVEPEAIEASGSLTAAVRAYHPHTVVWRYRAADEPRLRPWSAASAATPAAAASPKPEPVAAAKPASGPAAEELENELVDEPPRPIAEQQMDSPDAQVTLTDEELAMLLDEGPLED